MTTNPTSTMSPGPSSPAAERPGRAKPALARRFTLGAVNRQGLVTVAERHGVRVIEDDPYAELRYSGQPVPSMATMTERDQLRMSFTTYAPEVITEGLRRLATAFGR